MEIYRPKGSRLAEEVSASIDAHVEQMAYLKDSKLNIMSKESAEEQRKMKENERILAEKFGNLGLSNRIKDVQKNIWHGGEITEPEISADVSGGFIQTKLIFSYPTAGYWCAENDEYSLIYKKEGYMPKLYTATEELSLGLKINEGVVVLHVGQGGGSFLEHPLDNNQEDKNAEKLIEMLVSDSKSRILEGRIPVSNLIEDGRKNIEDVKNFTRKYSLRLHRE